VADVVYEYRMPQMAGRIFGALLIYESPCQTMREFCEDLQAIKPAISIATRSLTCLRLP